MGYDKCDAGRRDDAAIAEALAAMAQVLAQANEQASKGEKNTRSGGWIVVSFSSTKTEFTIQNLI